jgi:dihydroflavonol-4-reductase
MSKDRILITGAAGFIGSHLIDYLIEQGITLSQLRLVVAPWDTLDNLNHLDLSKLEIITADIRDKSAMKKAVKGMNYVYHLAARIDFDGKTYAEYEDVNVVATRHLAQACRKQPIKKFIFYSSIGVFGLPAGIGNIENWDETHPKTYTNFYGKSKWEGEKVLIEEHKKTGLPYAIIRPASVYGPREKGPTLALYKAIKNKQFLMIGDGNNKMHYVYVKDLVAATYLAAKSRRISGDYIIAGNKPTTFKKIVRAIATSIGKTTPSWHIPQTVALVMGHGLELIGNIIGVKPPLFPSRVRTMTTTYFYNISKAKRELGYNPQVSFQQGVKITGRWYQQHGWV